MPFENPAVRSFTAVSIQRNAPQHAGIYGISNAQEWIFIGVASDIQAALLQHLRETNTPLSCKRPTGFTFEIYSREDPTARCQQLVREYAPSCVAKRTW